MAKISFTEHPASVGESYFEHMGVASSFGISMLLAGCACLVHAVLPFAFVKTGSDTITSLYLDSSALHLYRQTVQGIKNRFKLRIRFYDDNPGNPAFLEIKRRVTDVIIGFRNAYQMAQDSQPLEDKVAALEGYAERVIRHVR